MELRKTLLYFALAMLGVMLWHAWEHDYAPVVAPTSNATPAQIAAHPVEFAPAANTSQASSYQATPTKLAAAIPNNKNITVKTDVIDADINLQGGNIVDAKLLQYPVSLKEKNTSVQILNPNNDALYVAQSGLSVPNEKTAPTAIIYSAAKTQYQLKNGENQIEVILNGKTSQGISVQKTFIFKRGNYAINTAIELKNNSGKIWQGNIYNQIIHRDIAPTGFATRSYNGAAVSTENTPYKKLTFEDLSESNFSSDIHGGWLAIQQQYFLSAFIPPKNQTYHYYSRSFGNGDDGNHNIFVLGYMTPAIQLAPNATQTFDSILYVGPAIAKDLHPLAKGLSLTVDYGWLSPISKIIFWLMSEIHHFVGNWGWSIILVTILIKIAFYWLSNKSYVSMAKTRDLQPKIKALRDRHANDKTAMSKAMMELYRLEKINPLGGCLPMIIQIPVFIALYYVLIESVELRQAPFIFWIHDLSMKDPYFILPVLMGLVMLVQQKISPPPPDPAQAKMMMFLPVVFTIFFATFPAGLVLYWLTNSAAGVLQQWFVMKTHKKATRTVNR
ncbi:MAG TPA: membrane protein insertase YidC [Coxiellaceae bacterium]|nr:MAG: membrane protein insertase YidC [Gammaproteobacteria bacterium RIFCSPHIGHO2_12_FULL_36_30]HLB55921.1 membrane protein insertase YidC [Coxiellaceae bacterium]